MADYDYGTTLPMWMNQPLRDLHINQLLSTFQVGMADDAIGGISADLSIDGVNRLTRYAADSKHSCPVGWFLDDTYLSNMKSHNREQKSGHSKIFLGLKRRDAVF
ncbi:hypothetical protein K7432_013909 [Basidiobolus ranarum]|uniref:Uncharacterized protein n=1 Tax=Basidiobolus ranarum TaxID=34480 RepID=A0ABR2WIH0_9FUNG